MAHGSPDFSLVKSNHRGGVSSEVRAFPAASSITRRFHHGGKKGGNVDRYLGQSIRARQV